MDSNNNNTIATLLQQQMQTHMNTAMSEFVAVKTEIKSSRSELKTDIKDLRIDVNAMLEKSDDKYDKIFKSIEDRITEHNHSDITTLKFHMKLLKAITAVSLALNAYSLVHIHPTLDKLFAFFKK